MEQAFLNWLSMKDKNKIIVTGGAGFIGSHTVVELVKAGFEPIIVDDFSNSEPFILERLNKLTGTEIKTYMIDCRDKEFFKKVFQEEQNVEGVIHFAAYKAVGESYNEPLKYYDNNINSTLHLLNLLKEFRVPRFVFSSSCTVYGQPDSLPVNEEAPFKPALSPYGNTKRICEEMMLDFLKVTEGLKMVSLRYFNPIGAHSSGLIGELPRGVPNNLLPYIFQVATGEREGLTVYGNDYNTPDGTCLRDYIHVVDLAKAHIKSLEYIHQVNKKYDVFNLGTGKGVSVLEIIKAFEKVSGTPIHYSIGKKRDGDVESVFADPQKANQLLKWKAELSLEQAIADGLNFQRRLKNEEVYQK
jgi:UDP-glucose 4-epimerase